MKVADTLYQTVCVNLPASWNREFDDLGTAAEAYGQGYCLSNLFTGPIGSRLCSIGLGLSATIIGFCAIKILTGMHYPSQEGDTRVLTKRNVTILVCAAALRFYTTTGISLIAGIALARGIERSIPSLNENLYAS